jgi:predicted ATP-grasp superfamily ATP-dependent carboligase
MALATRVLIAGVSVRAAAASAARAGFAVTAIDAFGDVDQHPSVRSLALQRDFGMPFSARTVARTARGIESDAVVYLSSFENHPREVAALAQGRMLWGNPPAVLQQVRDPVLVARVLRQRGIPAPEVHMEPFDSDPIPRQLRNDRCPSKTGGRWLVKPLTSGGGHRVRIWRGDRLARGSYRQELIEGPSGSVVFVAANRRAVPLGVSRQLVGESEFGAAGYRYCGNILAAAGDPQFARDEALADAASVLASIVTEQFDLIGVNGIDFVACDGSPVVVEVNPRWSASMELIERAYELSVFEAHAGACASGALPEFDFLRARRGAGAVGKAVVFARRDVTVGDTGRWLSEHVPGQEGSIADVPHPGERIPAGRPVCTVFGDGPDATTCHAELVRCAERVYTDLAKWESVTARSVVASRPSR